MLDSCRAMRYMTFFIHIDAQVLPLHIMLISAHVHNAFSRSHRRSRCIAIGAPFRCAQLLFASIHFAFFADIRLILRAPLPTGKAHYSFAYKFAAALTAIRRREGFSPICWYKRPLCRLESFGRILLTPKLPPLKHRVSIVSALLIVLYCRRSTPSSPELRSLIWGMRDYNTPFPRL